MRVVSRMNIIWLLEQSSSKRESMKKAILSLLALVTMASCTEDISGGLTLGGDEVRFSTSNTLSRSTVDKSYWEGGDLIGLYAMDSSSAFTNYNVPYVATTGEDTSFTPAGKDKIYYTGYTTTDKFVAYYPYDEDITSEVIDIDIDNNQYDLLVSGIVEQSQKSGEGVKLEFSHALTLVEISLKTSLEYSDLSNLKLYITNSHSNGTYDLKNQKLELGSDKLNVEMTVDQDAKVAKSIVMPCDYSSSSVTVYFEVNGDAYYKEISPDWDAGYKYTYSATLGNNDITFSLSGIETWGGTETVESSTSIADIIYKDEKYYIYSGRGLAAFRDLVNGSGYSSNATFWGFEATQFDTPNYGVDGVLANDIDLSGVCYEGDDTWPAVSWSPIGIATASAYAGTFDGGGYLVSDLHISNSLSKQGLFGYVGASGVVYNLGVEGKVVNSADNCYESGGIASWNNGLIINCYNLASIYGYSNVGGIVGCNEGNVINCYNQGTVKSAGNNSGGLIGHNRALLYAGYNSGNISGGGNVGAIVGWNNTPAYNGEVYACFYLEGTATYSVGASSTTTAGSTSSANLQTYASTLSTAATTCNSTYTFAVDACSWKDVSGAYPTLTFE